MSFNWNWDAEVKNKGNEGFNNAGILTFNSNLINSFVREMFQNSNDAKSDKKQNVKIRIERKKISRKSIPAYDQFEKIINLVKESNPSQNSFFNKVSKALKNDKIDFLIYSDFNTIGLSGKDSDDFNSSFAACVLSEGISAKENNNAGGSFGIGKNAIYSISNIRTVFYSSLNEAGQYIFQGVAKLASYKKGNNNHESRVYLGEGKKRLSVRNPDHIPEQFKRHEPGLSQFVMGVDLDATWEKDIVKAVLRNYWSLLLESGLEVEILNDGKVVQTINSANTITLMKRYFKDSASESTLQPNGNPLYFAEALEGEKVEFDIPHLGKCDFFYKEMPNGENNIAYLRNGMVVFTKIEQRLPGASITGVFRCQSQEGNSILRKMEPPQHNSFEPEMLARNHNYLTKADGEKITARIRADIRNKIKALIDKYKVNIETPPFLSELFEDLQKSIEGYSRGERKNEKSETETLPRRAAEENIKINLSSQSQNSLITVKGRNMITAAKGSDSFPPLRTGRRLIKPSKKSNNTGNRNKSKESVFSRVFYHSTADGKNIHKGIIRSLIPKITNAEFRISQYADSGNEIAFILHEITDEQDKIIPFNTVRDQDGLITDYMFVIDELIGEKQLYFTVTENQKSAFILN